MLLDIATFPKDSPLTWVRWNTHRCRLPPMIELTPTLSFCNLELATWVKNQRQAYRYMLDKKTDKKPTKRISPDRVTRLNHMGFEWRKYVRADEWKTPAGKRAAARQKNVSKPGCDPQPIETTTTPPAIPLHSQN
jgi:hypothetical protein